MNKGFIVAMICFFMISISVDYFLTISLSLTASKNAIIKSLLIHLVLSFVLSNVWFLLLKLIYWLLESTIGTFCVIFVGISTVIIVPLWLVMDFLIETLKSNNSNK